MSLPRAVARGVGYPLLAIVAIALFPLTLAVAVATNYKGTAERVDGIPGVRAEGGALSSAVALSVAIIVVIVVVGGAISALDVSPSNGPNNGSKLSSTPTASQYSPTETEIRTSLSTRNTEKRNFEHFSSTFVSVLEDTTNISIKRWYIINSDLYISYEGQAPVNETRLSHNVSLVTGAYNSGVENLNSSQPSSLNVKVTAPDNTTIATYKVKTVWARKVANGSMALETELEKVSNTLEIEKTKSKTHVDSD